MRMTQEGDINPFACSLNTTAQAGTEQPATVFAAQLPICLPTPHFLTSRFSAIVVFPLYTD